MSVSKESLSQKELFSIFTDMALGVAISGIIQTFAFAFGPSSISLNWWGNNVATQGVDFLSYNQNATLLPLPAKGYFGPDPVDWPRIF